MSLVSPISSRTTSGPDDQIINTPFSRPHLPGKLAWSAGNFSQVAEDINLQLEGETHEPILHASLRDDSGDLHESCVNLAECIKNEDGHLRFMDCF